MMYKSAADIEEIYIEAAAQLKEANWFTAGVGTLGKGVTNLATRGAEALTKAAPTMAAKAAPAVSKGLGWAAAHPGAVGGATLGAAGLGAAGLVGAGAVAGRATAPSRPQVNFVRR